MSNTPMMVIDGTKGLPELTQKLVEAHKLARTHANSAIKAAVECGKLLLIAKEGMGRGSSFENWIADKCPFSRATAYNYMKAAKSSNALDGSALRHLFPSGRKPPPKVATVTTDIEALDAMHKMQATLDKGMRTGAGADAPTTRKETQDGVVPSSRGANQNIQAGDVQKVTRESAVKSNDPPIVHELTDKPARYSPDTCWRWSQASPAMKALVMEVAADKKHVNARAHAVVLLMDLLDVSADQVAGVWS